MAHEVRIDGIDQAIRTFEKKTRSLRRYSEDGLRKIGSDLLRRSVARAPIKTGHLRSTGFTETENLRTIVGYTAEYALAQHEGLPPRVITAKRAKVLAVPIEKWGAKPVNPYGSHQLPVLSKDGQFVILGKHVDFPGFAGTKYLEGPLKENIDRYVGFIAEESKRLEG